MNDSIVAVDLFCGAGGLSTGLVLAGEDLDRDVELHVVNHWEIAIETHEANHPDAVHYHSKIEELHPPNVVEPGTVDVLIAAPECTHFSTARGGKPVREQKRTPAFRVLDWVHELRPEAILLENVPEFEKWGPIEDGQPTRNGEVFDAWITNLHALGYSVDWTTLNAADYGDATSRERLFVVGRRGQRAAFPDPTHSEDGEDGSETWRPASEIIDWTDPGESIWGRSRPLVQNTMQRIAEGLRRFGTDDLEPFADAIGKLDKADVEAMQEDPVAVDEIGDVVERRCEPFLVRFSHGGTTIDLDDPVPTITTAKGGVFALCEPYLLGQQSGAAPKNVDEDPCPTIATGGAISKIEPRPFVLPRNGFHRGLHSNPAYDPDERPLHTVTAQNHDGHLVTPYLVQYNGQSGARSLEDPLPTQPTRDRFALVVPDLYPWGLDVRFRMLQPRELAAAMGFPEDYEFAGNKTETIEQIGNAVPVNLAKALVEKILTSGEPSLQSYGSQQPTALDAGGDD